MLQSLSLSLSLDFIIISNLKKKKKGKIVSPTTASSKKYRKNQKKVAITKYSRVASPFLTVFATRFAANSLKAARRCEIGLSVKIPWRRSPSAINLPVGKKVLSARWRDPTLNFVGGATSAWANHCSTFARPWPRNFGMIGRPKLSLFIGESYFTAQ